MKAIGFSRRLLSRLVAGCMFATLFAEAEMSPMPPSELPFTEVLRMSYPGFEAATTVVIRSRADLDNIFGKDIPPALSAEPLEAHMLIGVGIGRRNTGGYAVKIHSVRLDQDVLRIQAVEVAPPSDAMVTMAMTSPATFIRLPATPGRVEVTWDDPPPVPAGEKTFRQMN